MGMAHYLKVKGSDMNRGMGKLLVRTSGLAIILGYQIYQNRFVRNRVLELYYEDLPEEADNYRIVHISDLHGAVFGKNNQKLEEMIMALEPDVLCITGDMVHQHADSGDAFKDLIKGLDPALLKLYVTGNHEMTRRTARGFERLNRSVLFRQLENYNLVMLDGSSYIPPGMPMAFSGISDDYELYEGIGGREEEFIPGDHLPMPEKGFFNVALVHRPNYFRSIADYGYSLMLSGHVHGGVIRLAGKGGLLSPDLSLFPEFDKGLFVRNGSYLHVTSGLGLGKPIPRVANRPEIVLIVLRKGAPDLSKLRKVEDLPRKQSKGLPWSKGHSGKE